MSSAGKRRLIALAGNPNVGKSTLFNALTGMRQHTGNWPGKTVACARGICGSASGEFELIDIPGCYSLAARSAEEEIARDILCSGECDAAVVVCSATCLERGMVLALQIMELIPNVVICVNLLDEAARKGITVDLGRLSTRLGIPVVGTTARSKNGLEELLGQVDRVCDQPPDMSLTPAYPAYIERTAAWLEPELQRADTGLPPRWLALRLIEGGGTLPAGVNAELSQACVKSIQRRLGESGITGEDIERVSDDITKSLRDTAKRVCSGCVKDAQRGYSDKERRWDRILTGKYTRFPLMALLLALVLWLTAVGANYPSALLSSGFLRAEEALYALMSGAGAAKWLCELLARGVFRTLGWVISVMLPPMAIFFPLFTLLEDVGLLPRIAFNLDHSLKRCGACGKQALTMCMGFGCNAVGVTGCRIIDSPRERMLALLTNSFVPCNGRLPTLVTITALFFAMGSGVGASVCSALILTAIIFVGIAASLLMSRVLSETVLRGVPSAYTLELPPYRPPQVLSVIVRSVLDRTLFVLGRAAAVAAPAGLVLWTLANIRTQGGTLLSQLTHFLEPAGRAIGMDGVILTAFILGFPANETVVPIMIMAYSAQDSMMSIGDNAALHGILAANGWSPATALCFTLFMLMHWPCSTTVITIYKETHSVKWTAMAILLPTAAGVAVCAAVAAIWRIFL